MESKSNVTSNSGKYMNKRVWESWNAQETEAFFQSLKELGKDFDAITKKIQTKNYEQVRHFYYRVLKKINKLLKPIGFPIDKSSPLEVLNAILSYWDTKKSVMHSGEGKGEEEFALHSGTHSSSKKHKKSTAGKAESSTHFVNSLKLRIQQGRIERAEDLKKLIKEDNDFNQPPKKKIKVESSGTFKNVFQDKFMAPVSIQITKEPIIDSSNTLQETKGNTDTSTSSSSLGKKLICQFTPLDKVAANILSSRSINPRLQLTLKATKSISYIINYLMEKWINALKFSANGHEQHYDIKIIPQDINNHRGWTKENAEVTINNIFQLLGFPSVLKFNYSFYSSVDNLNHNQPTQWKSIPKSTLQEGHDLLMSHNSNSFGFSEVINSILQQQKDPNNLHHSNHSNHNILNHIPSSNSNDFSFAMNQLLATNSNGNTNELYFNNNNHHNTANIITSATPTLPTIKINSTLQLIITGDSNSMGLSLEKLSIPTTSTPHTVSLTANVSLLGMEEIASCDGFGNSYKKDEVEVKSFYKHFDGSQDASDHSHPSKAPTKLSFRGIIK